MQSDDFHWRTYWYRGKKGTGKRRFPSPPLVEHALERLLLLMHPDDQALVKKLQMRSATQSRAEQAPNRFPSLLERVHRDLRPKKRAKQIQSMIQMGLSECDIHRNLPTPNSLLDEETKVRATEKLFTTVRVPGRGVRLCVSVCD
jgi:hypothetical protein